MSPLILVVWAFVVGACVGSFLNVCIARWPADLSVVKPRSRCPNCGLQIAWYDNLPIISWILLRARCRGCGLHISFQYPLVELVVGLLWAACVYQFGLGFTAVRIAIFITILLGIAITDFKHYLIPDGFTVSGLVFVVATALISGFRLDVSPFAGPWDAIVGACAGAGAVSIVGWLGEVTLKKEAMGFGDVTLMAVVGGAVGPGRALLVLFMGAALGAAVFVLIVLPVVKLRGAPAHAVPAPAPAEGDVAGEEEGALPHVPFGVFLAPAAVVALLWGDVLISWYLNQVVTG
ncbi:MAG: prepilin peptidase [Cytophagaceae bacterium]|nr:prepilin peptidase [Gemmatimonadaceae bacterium]